jgi:hypothetical protein
LLYLGVFDLKEVLDLAHALLAGQQVVQDFDVWKLI